MPELPEVETVVRALRPRLRGREVLYLQEDHPGVFLRHVDGPDPWPRRITGIGRRAKLILVELEGPLLLVVHLRMTGHLSLTPAAEPPARHTHVRIGLDSGEELRFRDTRRFGRLSLETPGSLASLPFYASLGPEPFDLSIDELQSRIGRGSGSLKASLLDQRRVAGIGNIYADEILHAAGLHPAQPANTVLPKEFGPLLVQMQRILGSAIRGGGSTIRDYRSADGQAGQFQNLHQVFGRGGEPCPTCEVPIRKIRVAGRGTHFCPACQPLRRRRKRRRST